jgi:hypothetical protein
MALNAIEKAARQMLARRGQIDARDAARLSDLILADHYVSRTERRFLRKLLKLDVCDKDASEKLGCLLEAA